jgi:hypothetical protein
MMRRSDIAVVIIGDPEEGRKLTVDINAVAN